MGPPESGTDGCIPRSAIYVVVVAVVVVDGVVAVCFCLVVLYLDGAQIHRNLIQSDSI